METVSADDLGVNESRFYMWRAVFAMAHADGRIAPEEFDFMENYLNSVPFSGEQIEILLADMKTPQEIGAMLEKVSEKQDQSQFFQFARMLCWCDGDYDEQEQVIFEDFLKEQMAQFNIAHLRAELKESRNKSAMQLLAEDKEFKERAQGVVGIGPIISRLFGEDIIDAADGLRGSTFYMWRAIFAMAHADEVVTAEERAYMMKVLVEQKLSPKQRETLMKDMEEGQDVGAMFVKITNQDDRTKFFEHARDLCWSDGDYAAQEQEILTRLKTTHVKSIDFNKMLEGDVGLQFVEDKAEEPQEVASSSEEELPKEERKKGIAEKIMGVLGGDE